MLNLYSIQKLTSFWTNSGRVERIFLIVWKTSIEFSNLNCSIRFDIAIYIPDLSAPSLEIIMLNFQIWKNCAFFYCFYFHRSNVKRFSTIENNFLLKLRFYILKKLNLSLCSNGTRCRMWITRFLVSAKNRVMLALEKLT